MLFMTEATRAALSEEPADLVYVDEVEVRGRSRRSSCGRSTQAAGDDAGGRDVPVAVIRGPRAGREVAYNVTSRPIGNVQLTMMRQGPISRFLHGAIEYLAGVLLVAAPFLFSFESDAATAVAVIAGVIVLVIAASTEGPTSLINSIPMATHVRARLRARRRADRVAVSVRLQRRDQPDGVLPAPRHRAPARDDRDALQARARRARPGLNRPSDTAPGSPSPAGHRLPFRP